MMALTVAGRGASVLMIIGASELKPPGIVTSTEPENNPVISLEFTSSGVVRFTSYSSLELSPYLILAVLSKLNYSLGILFVCNCDVPPWVLNTNVVGWSLLV